MNFKEKVQNGCNIIGTHVNLINANITKFSASLDMIIYGLIWSIREYANTRIRKAVVADSTSGHGYGILSPIAQNAI